MEGDIGLVAGRSQREKRRSYKDLLREEEEIAAQVRNSSKKHLKVTFSDWGVKEIGNRSTYSSYYTLPQS